MPQSFPSRLLHVAQILSTVGGVVVGGGVGLVAGGGVGLVVGGGVGLVVGGGVDRVDDSGAPLS